VRRTLAPPPYPSPGCAEGGDVHLHPSSKEGTCAHSPVPDGGSRGWRQQWFAASLAALLSGALPVHAADCAASYETRSPTGQDATGRFYLGRETSLVMGHLGASWLERPEREAEERPSLLILNLGLKPADVVAYIGAGTGYFAFRMAPLVPRGKVLAVDIQPEMLSIVRDKAQRNGVANVQPVLGKADDPALAPGSVDLVLMVDVYHEFSRPCEMMHAVVQALRPGGRVALVEYRAEDPGVPIKPLHKMSRAQAEKEMAAVGLKLQRTFDGLPWQHLMFFEKR
jgi:SAM-dependent methyltransferase